MDEYTGCTCGHSTIKHDIKHGRVAHPCQVCDCKYYDPLYKARLRGDQ